MEEKKAAREAASRFWAGGCGWGGDWVMALRCQRRTAARAAVLREAAAANDSRGGGRLEGGEEALMVADRWKETDGVRRKYRRN